LTVAPGSRLIGSLPASGTTGYSWVVSQLPRHVRFVGSDYVAAPQPADGPSISGGEGRQKLTFEAKAVGVGTLQLAYRQAWNGGSKAETYRLRIVSRR
jgi:predicted secreted protein